MPFLPLAAVTLNPLLILALSVVFIVVVISWFRLHAFFALTLAAFVVSLLIAAGQTGDGRFVKAIESVMTEFGSMAGKLGFSIALAAVIGSALMESGAADKIVRRFVAVLGESRAALALLACSFVLAAPVFVDTVFMLLLPLARALAVRTGKNYLLYVLAIGAGAVVTNGIVPPAPGPLMVADTLKIEIGQAILVGFLFGALPALGGLMLAKWFDKRMAADPRAAGGLSVEAVIAQAEKPESELPAFLPAVAPVLVPLVLIALASTVKLFHVALPIELGQLLQFLGNKNVALLAGAVIALAVLAHQKKLKWSQVCGGLGKPLETGAIIILIVSAGGAYGATIQQSGVGNAVRALAGERELNHVLLAWVITALVRGAQGSATVATIAGVGIMQSIAVNGDYGVHPLYIFLAIGFGSKCLPWMNDAGFWVVSRMSGLSQGQMLRTWSPVLSLISILGLLEVLLASALWPHLWF